MLTFVKIFFNADNIQFDVMRDDKEFTVFAELLAIDPSDHKAVVRIRNPADWEKNPLTEEEFSKLTEIVNAMMQGALDGMQNVVNEQSSNQDSGTNTDDDVTWH